MSHRPEQPDGVDGARPEWFAAFLADRGTRKPSAHTLKAYRQDFDAIAALIAGGENLSGMAVGAIMVETMRTAFARYAQSHEAASIQRCWSTWNVVCTYLYTAELIAANPMPMVGRPKLAKTLPKALPADAVAALLTTLSADPRPRRRSDWMERDRALILTAQCIA
jgi:site-specific recombinase XerC